jgi:GTPase SAR1 family protein
MYSVASWASFKNLEAHRSHKIMRQDAIFILVGNQCDVDRGQRQVSNEEGEAAAREFGCAFAETSAKTGHDVRMVVERLVRAVRERKEMPVREENKSKKSRCQIQ